MQHVVLFCPLNTPEEYEYVFGENIEMCTKKKSIWAPMKIELTVQYIHLSDTLTSILRYSVVWQECTKSQNRLVSDGVLSDISDELVYKSN